MDYQAVNLDNTSVLSIDALHDMVAESIKLASSYPDLEHLSEGYIDINRLSKDPVAALSIADFKKFLSDHNLYAKTKNGIYAIVDFNGLKFTVDTTDEYGEGMEYWSVSTFIRESVTLHVSPKDQNLQ